MFVLNCEIPRKITVACSGGVDSMAVVDFLRRSHEADLLFVDHLTDTSEKAFKFLFHYAATNKLKLTYKCISHKNSSLHKSQEEWWREERYRIFHSVDGPVITCHHLDDAVETWVWSSMHGTGKVIPTKNRNVIRPFLLNKKEEFVSWCLRKNVDWSEDLSNANEKYTRNFIRHTMMPNVLRVNPGIHKTIMKKYTEGEDYVG